MASNSDFVAAVLLREWERACDELATAREAQQELEDNNEPQDPEWVTIEACALDWLRSLACIADAAGIALPDRASILEE